MPGETILSGARYDRHVSEFRVLQSGAGWYIGTLYLHCDCEPCLREGLPPGFEEPNSRETGYFETEAEARAALEIYRDTGMLPKVRR